jgi:hypothetical protein
MDGTDFLPNDLRECQQLLLAAFQQATQLERRVVESEQQVAELNRVLSETSASYESLQQEHATTLDELAWYKRWAYGRRRERFREGEGQGHLFDLEMDLPANADFPEPTAADDEVNVQGHCRRRKKREIDWDKLPQIRHEHDLRDRHVFCEGSPVICTPMPSRVTMRSFSVRTRPFGKWLVGRMRGGSSSMP